MVARVRRAVGHATEGEPAMPIANCTVAADLPLPEACLVARWARESGQPAEHMTINVVARRAQYGAECAVMAELLLPSLWPDESVSALQLGLARALAAGFKLPAKQVQVVTLVVGSGRVVADGREQSW